MSRLSFRPRPLDIHKKLPIVKSLKEFEDDDVPSAAASTRNSQLPRRADADNEVVMATSQANLYTGQVIALQKLSFSCDIGISRYGSVSNLAFMDLLPSSE